MSEASPANHAAKTNALLGLIFQQLDRPPNGAVVVGHGSGYAAGILARPRGADISASASGRKSPSITNRRSRRPCASWALGRRTSRTSPSILSILVTRSRSLPALY
jgi:hypothetical protein